MHAFVNPQISYCLLVWIFHKRVLSNGIKRLHQRYLHIVYSYMSIKRLHLRYFRIVYSYMSCSYEELLEKDGSVMTKVNFK